MRIFTQRRSLYLLSMVLFTAVSSLRAQTTYLESKPTNYNEFRDPVTLITDEVVRVNAGFEQHPELGLLYAGAPCTNCYEVLEKRTEKTKTFAEIGSDGRHVFVQSSTESMHYKNERGEWLTIQPELGRVPGRSDFYASVSSPWPVAIDTREGNIQIGRRGERVAFNNLVLIYVNPDGVERVIGKANWRNHRAGNGGMYVTDIWPDIDMEVKVYRGGTKTNFLIKRPNPAYANGRVIIRDSMQMDNDLYVFRSGQSTVRGPLEIRTVSGRIPYRISEALIWENGRFDDPSLLDYRPAGQRGEVLDIIIPGDWFNRRPNAYPITVDPFFQSTNATTVTGSDYVANCNSITGGCTFVNSVPVPPAITVTDVRFTFGFLIDTFPDRVGFDFRIGNCRHPNAPTGNWGCDVTIAQFYPPPYHCVGLNRSIFDAVSGCIPKPQCPSYNLDVTLRILRCYRPLPAGCTYTGIFAYDPFIVTVEGWTLEPFTVSVDAPNATICEGDSTLVRGTPVYGVRPFQYLWLPTGQTDSAIMVKPTVNTTYIVQFTDSCGRTAADTVEVFVTPSDNPGFTFEPDSVCPRTPINIKGNDAGGQLSYYSWDVPGSAHPTLSSVREFTTTYAEGGVYDITMYYQSGNCKFPYTEQITIHPEVKVEIYDTICDGDVYEFYGNLYTTPGVYKHINKTTFGCDSILILHLQVNPIPPIPVITANNPVCYGDDLVLEASEILGVEYAWTGPRGFTNGNRKFKIEAVNFDMAGIYTVTSTRLNCTSPPGEVRIVVKKLPEISITADRTDICSGDSVRVETIANDAYTYQWKPEHVMRSNGSAVAYGVVPYKTHINVIVTDTGKCVSMDSIYINTEPCCEVFLPDAFTPNNDGRNDVFRIVTNGNLVLKEFRVVNRWGMTVFATASQHIGWDGLHNGKPQDPGTYHYYLEYSCPDGGTYEMKGVVTLLR